ncbi:MAG TPA: protein-L-isoaspartate(D-aspartate) O-methyltransferase [Planctomycetaceae bacterium]|nr:protein-L-isoaspartate(D-aspartate) O-methyltransferase [Planctomycetaceae bacterium]
MTSRWCLCVAWLAGVAVAVNVFAQGRDTFREAREKMVSEYIEREGIRNPRVLSAMRLVPRHEFVPLAQRNLAYFDSALAIGQQQTISPPFIVAFMTEALDPQSDDVVLEIGTGSGYQAAVLSPMVKEVYTIEIVESLGKTATDRLKRLGYDNVHVKVGDGYLGWPEHAPFDKIIVTCSPENVPKPLVDQLREGGKMVVPLGQRYDQIIHLFEKRDGKLQATKLINTLFVPMTGASEAQRQVKPDPLHPHIKNGGFEEDANADSYPDHWHYQRLISVVSDGGPNGSPCAFYENDQPGRPSQSLQGMAIDGTKLGSVRIELDYKLDDSREGTEAWHKPAVVVHFYDDQRRVIAEPVIGPWLDTDGRWSKAAKTLPVPQKAREMIFRVGLNGATGKLWVDNVSLTPLPR